MSAYLVDVQFAVRLVQVPPHDHSKEIRADPHPGFIVEAFVVRERILGT